jgi:phage terminase Nu1 subunit (DNA packaging protein)
MTEPMGLREFGRWVDLSGEGVRKAIREGRIPAEFVGERTVGNGKKWPVITDPEAARRALGRNTNHAMQRDKAVLSENRARVAKGQPKRPPAEIAAGEVADEPAGAGTLKAGKEIPSQASSNALTAAYKARMAKIEYEERIGKLVNAADIEARLVTMLRSAVTRVRGVPTKAKGRLPHLTVSDIELLEEMIDECLTELANYGS